MKLFIFLILFLGSALAYETDQFSVAPRPLKDIGPMLSAFIYQNLQSGVAEVNQQLKDLPSQIQLLEKELEQYPQELDSEMWTDHPARSSYKALKDKISKQKQLFEQLKTDFGVITYLHQKYSLTITWNEQRDGVFGVPLAYANLQTHEKYEDLYYNQG